MKKQKGKTSRRKLRKGFLDIKTFLWYVGLSLWFIAGIIFVLHVQSTPQFEKWPPTPTPFVFYQVGENRPMPITSVTSAPTPTLFPTPTFIPMSEFDVTKCQPEGDEKALNQIITNANYMQQPNTYYARIMAENKAIITWEKYVYLAARIYGRDLIQSTNPDFSIYASPCTKDYLSMGFMGGGEFINIIHVPTNITGIYPANNAVYPSNTNYLDPSKLVDDIPLSKTDIDFANDEKHITVAEQNFTNKAIEENYYTLSLQNKTFPANYEVIQQNDTRQYGLIVELTYFYNGNISAQITFDANNKVLSFMTY